MVSVEIVALVLTGLGLAASIIYYANILQNANKTQQIQIGTRQTQLFMYLYDKWSGETFSKNWYDCMSWNWTDYENYMEKYGYNVDKDAFAGFQSIIGFFEGLGVLVKDGEIRTSLVEDLMSRQIIEFWEKFKAGLRERGSASKKE